MPVEDLLQDKVAQELLGSRELARLAYVWKDGTPRVVPIWFHWTGSEIVLASPAKAPKVKALEAKPGVAITIDSNTWPARVLLVRGTAKVERRDGVVPEYAEAAERYFGPQQGKAWVEQASALKTGWARIAVTPTEVRILDFEVRWPSAIASAMPA
ncbi:MAG TPA: pyridoxamine 5'-phosphate oxidase family protein [Acidimicrobiales bacterium]|nr:pyridoxamine 5'-phosphate oxidase family protein [Acidimicrobiales bacterium]